MVVGEGFEPSKANRQIYSLIPLTTREPHQIFLLIVHIQMDYLKQWDGHH